MGKKAKKETEQVTRTIRRREAERGYFGVPYFRQYEAVRRAYQQLKKSYQEWKGEPDLHGAYDALKAFLNESYSLKEHLKLHLRRNMDASLASRKYLCLAEDLCNAIKHGAWSRHPKSDHKKLTKRIVKLTIGLTGKVQPRIEIVVDQVGYDALDLAKNILGEWDTFLSEQGISFDDDKTKKI